MFGISRTSTVFATTTIAGDGWSRIATYTTRWKEQILALSYR